MLFLLNQIIYNPSRVIFCMVRRKLPLFSFYLFTKLYFCVCVYVYLCVYMCTRMIYTVYYINHAHQLLTSVIFNMISCNYYNHAAVRKSMFVRPITNMYKLCGRILSDQLPRVLLSV